MPIPPKRDRSQDGLKKRPLQVRKGYELCYYLANTKMEDQPAPRPITGIQVLAVIFVIVIATEVGYATVSTSNYFQFYRALSQLEVRLASFQDSASQGGQGSNVAAIFSVENPTPYSGMVMKEFSISFTVTNSSNGRQLQGSTGLTPPIAWTSLDPGNVANVTNSFSMALPASGTLYQFVVTVGLSTFLDPISGFQTDFSCDSTQQACTLLSTTPLPMGGYGPGGGGGGV